MQRRIKRVKKFAHLDHAYTFQPIAFETSGTIGSDSMCFLRDLMQETLVNPTHLCICYSTYQLQYVQVGNSTFVIGSLANKCNDCDSEDFV